jgi:hypothetical protein
MDCGRIICDFASATVAVANALANAKRGSKPSGIGRATITWLVTVVVLPGGAG